MIFTMMFAMISYDFAMISCDFPMISLWFVGIGKRRIHIQALQDVFTAASNTTSARLAQRLLLLPAKGKAHDFAPLLGPLTLLLGG